MKIGIVGPTYQQVSLPFDAQRTINLYPVLDQMGKEIAAMYGAPGLIQFADLGNAVMRAEFNSATGRAFAICGANFYEIDAAGNGTLRGSLKQSNGIVYMEENAVQLGICDGINLYIFTYATNTFQTIVGGLSYVKTGDMSVSGNWTKGSGWSISGLFAYANAANTDLSQTSPQTLVAGISYTLQYTIGGASFVTNGGFDTDTGWTKGSGWTISGGAANAATSSAAVSQTSPQTLVNGEKYSVTFTATVTSGTVACSLGGGTAGTAISASSTVTQIITAGATQATAFTGSSFVGSIDNISITQVIVGTVVPKIGGTSGVIRTGAGTYNETIVAGATQAIAFTGSAFTGSITNVSITDPAVGLPPSVGTLTFLDSFFLVNENGSGRFWKSQPNDGTQWAALDFATAESSPDNLKRVIAAVGQLWLMGDDTGEIWTDTGAAAFPFQKISGGKMTMGIIAPASAIELDNTLIWVGGNEQGSGIVFRASGFIPKRISTTPIEIYIREATDPTNIRAFAYQEDGHVFYILTGGGLATSLVYDITTDMWHERAYMNSQGVFEQHLGCCYMKAFGKHLVGDRNSGLIYQLDSETYNDNGDPLVAERIYTHISDEDKRTRYNRLVIGVETGVGNQTGDGTDPSVELQLSKDGARTWSDWYSAKIGKAGEYLKKAVFRRLGVVQQMTFKIRISEDVKRNITGSYLQ